MALVEANLSGSACGYDAHYCWTLVTEKPLVIRKFRGSGAGRWRSQFPMAAACCSSRLACRFATLGLPRMRTPCSGACSAAGATARSWLAASSACLAADEAAMLRQLRLSRANLTPAIWAAWLNVSYTQN